MICKDTNSKAIHNRNLKYLSAYMLFMICKDTNSKAIHNKCNHGKHQVYVVYDMQRY